VHPEIDIQNIIKDKISSFIGTTNEDGTYKDRIYQSARSSSIQISTDYGRRYLVELVQNGYDAHSSAEKKGKVKIYLDPSEGEHGVLYVGNHGRHFNVSNLKALSDIGLSDKPAGESIGNKGLGFRSVLHICDEPEIYSCQGDPKEDGFNGYCFRFAKADDFANWIGNPNILKLAQADIPPFHIPFFLESRPDKLKLFSEEGFVTVIRLPLRDEIAQKSVFEELAKIKDSRAPILLFLRRLVTLQAIVKNDEKSSFLLTRRQENFKKISDNNDFELGQITLDETHKYLVAWKWLPEEIIKIKILESIANKDLHESWADWQGKGELAVAVRLDNEEIAPLLYTFLPMGSGARSPFRGFLHASFYPKSDRTSLRADIPLNELYLMEAIKLSARTIKTLVDSSNTSNPLIAENLIGNAIIDLLSWLDVDSLDWNGENSISTRLDELYTSEGLPIRSSELFPIFTCDNGKKWGAIEHVWKWDFFSQFEIFKASLLAEVANVQILKSSISKERVERLQLFLDEFDDRYTLSQDTDELAKAVELIAQKLHKQKFSIEKWQKFYLEIKDVSKKTYGLELLGRRFLLCNDGQLRGSQINEFDLGADINLLQKQKKQRLKPKSLQVEIFTPGQRLRKDSDGNQNDESVFKIPKALSMGFSFLDERLDWSGVLDSARKIFEEKKLVQKYDAEEIVAQISRIVSSSLSQKVRMAALRWVFRLYCATSDKPSILRRAKLYVPTQKDDWVPASDAIFSAGWPSKTFGETTSEFLYHSRSYSDELYLLHSCLIAPPSVLPFSNKETVLWTDFLSSIGVQFGLQPIKKDKSRFKIHGRAINADILCNVLGLGEKNLNYWRDESRISGEPLVYQSSSHTIDGEFWYLPGQNEHDEFSHQTKELYAELLLNWLRRAEKGHFELVFYTSSARYASRFSWPTPLAAFLRQSEWLPMEVKDNEDKERSYCRPSETWLADELKSERLPFFLPQFCPRIRRFVGDSEISKSLSSLCGAKILNENRKSTLIYQIDFLGQLWAKGAIDRFFQKDFINLYNSSWQRLMSFSGNIDWAVDQAPSFLIVSQKNSYVSFDITNDDLDTINEEIYVQDSESALRASLLLSLSKAVFDPALTSSLKLGELLKALIGERFRSINELNVEFILDGVEWKAGGNGVSLLVDSYPWVAQIVCLAIESLTGTAARRIPANRGMIIDRLNRIMFREVKEINIRIGDKLLQLPEELFGVLGVRDKDSPTIIFQLFEGQMSWPAFTRASNAFCDVLELNDIASPLKLIFRGFERLNVPLSHELKMDSLLDDLCPDLHLTSNQAREIIKFIENDKDKVIKFVRPVIHYFCGDEELKQFSIVGKKTEAAWDLTGYLKEILDPKCIDVEQLIRVSLRAYEMSEIRNAFKLNFEKFNISLIAIGEEPDTYPDLHKETFDAYIKENYEDLIDRLRSHYLQKYKKGESLKTYLLEKLEVSLLRPDECWLMTVYDPDEDLIRSSINFWFAEKGITEKSGKELLPYRRVREENNKQLKMFAKKMGSLVSAWCRKNDVAIPNIWCDPIELDKRIVMAFENTGALDFEFLDITAFYKWLSELGHWPELMPTSEDLTELGISSEEIESQLTKETEMKEQLKKEKRSVEINGKLIDPLEISSENAADEIFNNLNTQALNTKLTHEIDLEAATKAGSGGGPPGGGSGGLRPGGHLNSDRNEFVGFLGECAVYHWLKKLLPKQDIDAAWVSKNRSKLLSAPGNDSLGYDFVVKYKKQTWYLEVKTSVGDPQMFNMGESEVRFATINANQRGSDYKIIYLSNIDDSSKTRIEILPNPMASAGSKGYQIGGQGFRLSFHRK
jgi:hypothetical protein